MPRDSTAASALPFPRRSLSAFRRAVMNWSAAHQRALPWRSIGDPYRVWISEVMLQQTTVAAVIPYYQRFLQRFPDVQSLAAAEEADVLRLWEGLGYYSRARNLHRGAQEIVTRCGGQFPRDAGQLQELPGIGRYTAGAIASFAFHLRAPIVEANTLRLYARLLGFDGDPRSSAGQKLLWAFAEEILPDAPSDTRNGEFNQALMDLGATVCTPTEPKCPECPLKRFCRAFQAGRVHEIPQLAARPAVTEVTACTVAIRQKRKYLLRRCLPTERWAGLWDFPRFDLTESAPKSLERLVAQEVLARTGLQVDLESQIAEFRHSVTRYRITLKCFLAEFRTGELAAGQEWDWASPAHFSQYPLSVTGRKFANCLRDGLL